MIPPNPGSNEALALSCSCGILDNEYGQGYMGNPGVFCISGNCPLHREDLDFLAKEAQDADLDAKQLREARYKDPNWKAATDEYEQGWFDAADFFFNIAGEEYKKACCNCSKLAFDHIGAIIECEMTDRGVVNAKREGVWPTQEKE